MRQLIVATVAAVAAAGLGAGQVQAGKVEVKGVHLCCPQCVKTVGTVLGKVDGVSDAMCERASKTVTFTAKDAKAAAAGVKALVDAGFFGTATEDGKAVKTDAPAAKGKADSVTVKKVHVCCNSCKKAVGDLFKGAKIEYTGTGAQKDMTISAQGLDKAEVLEKLRKAGFNGTVD